MPLPQEALSGAGERVTTRGSFCRPWASWRPQQEKHGQATKYFADAIATGGLPPPAQQVRYNLAQPLTWRRGNLRVPSTP